MVRSVGMAGGDFWGDKCQLIVISSPIGLSGLPVELAPAGEVGHPGRLAHIGVAEYHAGEDDPLLAAVAQDLGSRPEAGYRLLLVESLAELKRPIDHRLPSGLVTHPALDSTR